MCVYVCGLSRHVCLCVVCMLKKAVAGCRKHCPLLPDSDSLLAGAQRLSDQGGWGRSCRGVVQAFQTEPTAPTDSKEEMGYEVSRVGLG